MTKDWLGPFDKILERLQRSPELVPCTFIRAAAIYVNDTLEIAWASARQVFGDAATHEDAFMIYDRLSRKDDELTKDDFIGIAGPPDDDES